MAEDWITTADAVQVTGYNAEQIRRLARSGKIKSRKWGKEWMIDRNSLLMYIQNEGRGPKAKQQPS